MHITKLHRRLQNLEAHKMLKPLFSQAVDKLGREIEYRFQHDNNPDICIVEHNENDSIHYGKSDNKLNSSIMPSEYSLDAKISPREFKNVAKKASTRTKLVSLNSQSW